MIDVQEAVMEAVPVENGAAVEVRELRKEFRRKDSRKRGEKRGAKRTRVALDGVTFTMEKGETVAILGRTARGSRRSSACSRHCSCLTAGRRAFSATTWSRSREQCAGS